MKLLICHFFHGVVNDVVLMNEAHNCVIRNCSFLLIPSVPVLRGKNVKSLCSLIHFTFLCHATGQSQILSVINAEAIVVRLLILTLFALLCSLFSLGALAGFY